MTIFSPNNVGTVETRKSSSFFFPSFRYLIMMRPSCGSRFSLMSSLAMIFTRLVIASFNFMRRRHHVLQNAVHAEAHAIFLFVRLHVNVARAALYRVREDQVHQLDDRSFLGGFLQSRQVHLGFFRRSSSDASSPARSFITLSSCSTLSTSP